MAVEWWRDHASRKGVRLHLSGLSPSGDPVGIVHHFDSHGKLKRLGTGCPKIEVPVLCAASCSSCVIFESVGTVTLPPGTLVGDPITSIETCCSIGE